MCILQVDNYLFFFFNDTATTEIYTLSLHDALPIYFANGIIVAGKNSPYGNALFASKKDVFAPRIGLAWDVTGRSEEHTSELQSQSNIVCRLLLEKKKLPVLSLIDVADGIIAVSVIR